MIRKYNSLKLHWGQLLKSPPLMVCARCWVPSGTQSHSKIRLKGHGLPHFTGKGKGDLYVRIIVKIPVKLDKKQRALLEELVKEDM